MGRKSRIHVGGGFYHVILRGNSRIRAEIAIKAADIGAASISEVARHFNRTQSGLSQAIKRLQTKNL